MIDVSEVVLDPNLAAQTFTIKRTTGKWVKGVWTTLVETTLTGYGSITVATPNDLKMIPEGDVVNGAEVFHSQDPIYTTRADETGAGAFSDKLIWRGELYRVLQVGPYEDFGYYRAVAVRMAAI